MTIDRIVKEIANVAELFKAKSKHSTTNACDLQKTFAHNVVAMISGMKDLSIADAAGLYIALEGKPYGTATAIVIKQIDDLVKQHRPICVGHTSKGACHLIVLQSLKHWWNYFTQSDWATLNDRKKQLSAKMICVSERAHLLGCRNPDEQSFKWLLTVVLSHHYNGTALTPIDAFRKLHDLKQCHIAERKSITTEEPTKDYPENPNDLSDALFQSAYGNEKPVAYKDNVQQLIHLACTIPLRKNSRLLHDAHMQLQSQGKREPCTSGEPVQLESHHPQNPDEEVLFAQYKADLFNLRNKRHRPLLQKHDEYQPETVAPQGQKRTKVEPMEMVQTLSKNGSIVISCGDHNPQDACAKQPANAEDRNPKGGCAEQPALAETTTVGASGISGDPFADAAVAALTSRNGGKKEENKRKKADEKKAAEAKLKAAEDIIAASSGAAAGDGKLSKPTPITTTKTGTDNPPTTPPKSGKKAMKATPMKSAKKVGPVKMAATKHVKPPSVGSSPPKPVTKVAKAKSVASPKVVSPGEIYKSIPADTTPGTNPAPIWYRQGIIYTVQGEKKFRGLRVRGDKNTGKSSQWGASKTKEEAWKTVVLALDEQVK